MTNSVHPTPEDYAEANKITWEEFCNKLDVKGVTDELLILRLKQGLNAKLNKVFNDKDAGIVYSKALVDYLTRHKYLDTALNLKGRYPSEKHKHEHSGTIVHDLTERMEKAIEATEDAIRGSRTSKSPTDKPAID